MSALLSLISSDKYTNEEADAGDLYSEVLFGWLMVGVSLVAPAIATAMAFREWFARLWELPAQLRDASKSSQAESPNTPPIPVTTSKPAKPSTGARGDVEMSAVSPLHDEHETGCDTVTTSSAASAGQDALAGEQGRTQTV